MKPSRLDPAASLAFTRVGEPKPGKAAFRHACASRHPNFRFPAWTHARRTAGHHACTRHKHGRSGAGSHVHDGMLLFQVLAIPHARRPADRRTCVHRNADKQPERPRTPCGMVLRATSGTCSIGPPTRFYMLSVLSELACTYHKVLSNLVPPQPCCIYPHVHFSSNIAITLQMDPK